MRHQGWMPLMAIMFVMAAVSGRVQANTTIACAEAASKYPAAAIACDNAVLIKQLLSSRWTANSSAAVEQVLRETSATPGVYGAAVAFTPATIRKFNLSDAPLLSPYCHEPSTSDQEAGLEDIQCLDIGDIQAGGYNYTDKSLPQTSWYTKISQPVNGTSQPSLSGVYFDKGGGEIWMDTFSVPVIGPDGKLAAVATADVRAEEPAANATNSTAAAAPAPTAKNTAESARSTVAMLLPVMASAVALLLCTVWT